MDCLLLYRFNLKRFELLVENLTLEDGKLLIRGSAAKHPAHQIHDNTLVNYDRD
jgi:hypothetical protein